MRQSATAAERIEVGAGLTDACQIRVLEAILSGESVTEAAKRAGVSRSTVHRWLLSDFTFQAALNSERHAAQRAAVARLDWIVDRAFEVVINALEVDNDARVALAILKGAGVLSGETAIGASDAKQLAAEAQAHSSERRARIAKLHLDNLLRGHGT